MSDRVLVISSRTGRITSVAASAVPMLAPGGHRPLTADEIAAYEREQAAAKASRVAALQPASARRAAVAEAAPAEPVEAAAQEPPTGGEPEQKRSGARRRTESTENEQES